MTLIELIERIKAIANAQAEVNTIVENDIFRLNEMADVEYGVFAYTQGEHQTSAERDSITYNFTFFFVGLLTDDRENMSALQSQAIEVLDTIIRTLYNEGDMTIGNYAFQPFNRRFTDDCAGCWVDVAITTNKTTNCI
jgi:hypothetical protein